MDMKEYQRQWYLANKAKHAAANKKRYEENKETILAAQKARRENNKDKVLQIERTYRENNKEKLRAKSKKKYENNKSYYVAKWSKRNAAKLQRTPAWLDAVDQLEIQSIYLYCAALRSCGLDYHVDHFYPLQGDEVSGLHVPSNLQVIPAEQNLRKSNSAPI